MFNSKNKLPIKVRAALLIIWIVVISVVLVSIYFVIDAKFSADAIEGQYVVGNEKTNTKDNFTKVFGELTYEDAKKANPGMTIDEYVQAQGGINNGEAGSIAKNEAVYKILANSQAYASKADVLAVVYEVAFPKYGKEVTLGMMGNIVEEGSFGQIEFKNKMSYWSGANSDVLAIAGKKLSSMAMVDTMLTGIKAGTEGIGVGCIQWSGPRREGLLNKYKLLASSFSESEMAGIEVTWMLDELDSSYQPVIKACQGKSAKECGSIICKEYEKPSNKVTKAVIRGKHAEQLESLLSGV